VLRRSRNEALTDEDPLHRDGAHRSLVDVGGNLCGSRWQIANATSGKTIPNQTMEETSMSNIETAEIIQFAAADRISSKRLEKIIKTSTSVGEDIGDDFPTGPILVGRRGRPLPEPLTESCKNQRLRLSRRDAWWAAGRLTGYWRARLDWQGALSTAQSHNVADANSFPKCEGRLELVDLWRTALIKQMLTPAPDVAAVAWKRAQMRAENYRYANVKPTRLQLAIDADVEWLEAHPSRKSIAASRQAKKD
jgi:hypothetical protein